MTMACAQVLHIFRPLKVPRGAGAEVKMLFLAFSHFSRGSVEEDHQRVLFGQPCQIALYNYFS